MEDNTIYVTMFKMFTVRFGDIMINGDDMKSDRLLRLFAYLLYNHERIIPSSELVDMLWCFEEVDNPIGALKNLVYRLRVLLKKTFSISDLITTGKGSYSINKDYHIEVDALNFEKECQKEMNTIDEYEEFSCLYTGKYLVEVEDDHNVITKRTYYDSVYIERIMEYANLLEEQGEYAKMEHVVKRALEINQLEEELYELLIRSLYYQKQYKQAAEMYRKTTELLYKSLGVKPSESMQNLFEMIKKQSHSEDADIIEIQKDLAAETPEGAFLCEYGTFREIYNMHSRLMGRLGICAHMCLVSVVNRKPRDSEDDQKYVEKIMEKMQSAMLSGLRIGDVLSRLSVNQFIVLLPSCNYENSSMVMNRVLRKIRYSLNHTRFDLEVTIEEVETKG
ncbi:BTAD domain-containing putative transcriptional regulator [Longibaculum muris]|uniref:AfsR/SARP family transcriptional regulator n=3 Tax=Longibaculum muris TaxID=1796628 RepID=UPI0029432DEA|nr:BTAD domain-containing putative transcriptional regulator [Longibaculum muris]